MCIVLRHDRVFSRTNQSTLSETPDLSRARGYPEKTPNIIPPPPLLEPLQPRVKGEGIGDMLANSEHVIIPPEKRKKRLVVYNHGKAEDVRARASDV